MSQTQTIKGVSVEVDPAGLIRVDPDRLSEVMDREVDPFELTLEEIEQDRRDIAAGIIPVSHWFARRMAEASR